MQAINAVPASPNEVADQTECTVSEVPASTECPSTSPTSASEDCRSQVQEPAVAVIPFDEYESSTYWGPGQN